MPPKRKKGMKNVRGSRSKKRIKKNGVIADLVANLKQEPESEIVKKEETSPIRQKYSYLEAVKHRTRIKCDECNKKFRFRQSYDRHKEMEHSKLPSSVQCEQCTVRCPDAAALKEHIRNLHERDIFECDKCKKKFVRYAHVLRHKAQSGCDGKPVAMYPCEICCAQFSRKDNLMVHLRLQHILGKKYTCKQCPYHTGKFSKLIIHARNNHTDTPIQYECDHCGKVTSSRAAICKHLEIHGEKKYACDVCGYSTHTLEVMRRHVLTHVEDKPHRCAHCDQTFIQRSQLIKHAQKHTDGADKGSPGAEEPVQSKAYTNAKAAPRPFACEVCGKRFRNELDMRRHVGSHTLERPRRCMYCVAARAYVRGEQLVRHVRKSHPRVFAEHLAHIRQVLSVTTTSNRVKKSELEAILQVLDAEAERILQGYGEGVLYGGMQETDDSVLVEVPAIGANSSASTNSDAAESSPLMSEEQLAGNLKQLLVQLIDKELLECFGWPAQGVDTVLEKVIEHCGAKPADREKWTRVQCLRENAKHLFLYVIEDKTIAKMLYSHTIDQIILHILTQVADTNEEENGELIDDAVSL